MNRKNWVSALLAVVMILSLTAMIILPSGAEATLTTEQIAALPLASTATKTDGKTEYKIDSVSELLAASHNAITNSANANTSNNFVTGETIYLTEDLDINDWDYTRFATYDPETGKYTTVGKMGVSTGNYRRYDPTAPGVECDSLAEVFATLYNGFNARNARYTYFYPNINGLNHTIYNFYAYNPLIGCCATGDTTISNLTMVNAKVETAKQDASLWTGTYSALLVASADVSGGVNFNNVHIRDSHLLSQTAANLGIFVAFSNNSSAAQRRDVDIINCSVINSVVESTAASTATASLLIGAADQHVTVKNTLLMDSVVKVNAVDGDYPGSLLTSNRYGNTVLATYKDIAVVNCQYQTKETSAPAIAIAMNFNVKTKSTTEIDGLYATGNTWATIDDTGAIVGEAKPLTVLVRDKANALGGSADGLIWGTNFKVDENVQYLRYTPAPTSGFARPCVEATDENVIAPLTSTTVMNLLNSVGGEGYGMWAWTNDMSLITTDNPNAGPKEITFHFAGEEPETFLTDYEGKIIASPTKRLQMQLREWKPETGRNIKPGYAWSEAVFEANAVYVEVPHDVIYQYNDDLTHTVSCFTCEETIHNQTVSCIDYAPESVFVMGDFYHPSVYRHECICGHAWEEIDDYSTGTIQAPFSIALDKESYSYVDNTAALNLRVKRNSNLNAMTFEVRYDPAVLTYSDYVLTSADYACVINDEKAAEGLLTVAVPNVAGGILVSDVITLNFTLIPNVDLNVLENSFTVDVTMTGAIVYTPENGTEDLSASILVRDASVAATTYYVETAVIPGDVNGDTMVDMLDAVLILAKLNGNIAPEQDSYAFLIMAADVNNDGTMNLVDADMILQYVTDMDVTLLPCDKIPAYTVIA